MAALSFEIQNVVGTCSICFEEVFDNDSANPCVKTECGHVFHHKCLDDWVLHGNDTCPNCRTACASLGKIRFDDQVKFIDFLNTFQRYVRASEKIAAIPIPHGLSCWDELEESTQSERFKKQEILWKLCENLFEDKRMLKVLLLFYNERVPNRWASVEDMLYAIELNMRPLRPGAELLTGRLRDEQKACLCNQLKQLCQDYFDGTTCYHSIQWFEIAVKTFIRTNGTNIYASSCWDEMDKLLKRYGMGVECEKNQNGLEISFFTQDAAGKERADLEVSKTLKCLERYLPRMRAKYPAEEMELRLSKYLVRRHSLRFWRIFALHFRRVSEFLTLEGYDVTEFFYTRG
jgi:hypothetical protein